MIITITGPSGSGKSKLEGRLVENLNAHKVISHTSRDMRINEKEGIDYFFVTKDFFNENKNDFFEFVEFSGNLYGAHKDQFLKDRLNVVVVEPEGKRQISEKAENVISVYLEVSKNTMKERMQKRGDSESDIQKRLKGDNISSEAGYDIIIPTEVLTEEEVYNFLVGRLNEFL